MRFVFLSCLALVACAPAVPKEAEKKERTAAAERARQAAIKRTCGSQDSFERLKALAFEDAARVRRAESPVLGRLASTSVIRMERPVAVSRDEALGVTVCRGRLILELPPGAEDAFDGDRRLEADVEYSAQPAADGSGPVFQMKGAEPIVYRLAAVDLRGGGGRTPLPAPAVIHGEEPPVATAQAPASPPAPAAPPRPAARPAPVPPPPPPPAPVPPPAPRPVAAARPSFDCGYARSRVEVMICADPALARADRAMAGEYYRALVGADPDARRALKRTRDGFLRFRDRCPDAGCVAQAYADRIDEIRDIAGGG